MDVVEPTLAFPSGGAAAGATYSTLPPPSPPVTGESDVNAIVAASMQAQLADFSSSVQKNITGDVVNLVKKTMGGALGALDKKVNEVAADVSQMSERVSGLSDKMDGLDAAQKKILLQLKK